MSHGRTSFTLTWRLCFYIYIYIYIDKIHPWKVIKFYIGCQLNLLGSILVFYFPIFTVRLYFHSLVYCCRGKGGGGGNLSLTLESFILEFHNKKKSKSSIRSSSSIYYSSSLATSTPGKEFKIIYSQMPLSKFPVKIECLKLDLHLSGLLVNKTTIKSSLWKSICVGRFFFFFFD